MRKFFTAAAIVGGTTTAFFLVGAFTGPAGGAAVSNYASTVGTGIANTWHGGVDAVQWGAGLIAPAPAA